MFSTHQAGAEREGSRAHTTAQTAHTRRKSRGRPGEPSASNRLRLPPSHRRAHLIGTSRNSLAAAASNASHQLESERHQAAPVSLHPSRFMSGPRRSGGFPGGDGGGASGASSNPLILQSRSSQDDVPQKFPPRPDMPKPVDLTLSEKELVERSRFLSETFKYSGYYVVPDASRTKLLHQHGLVSSSFAPDSGSTQIYTPTFERYSDRYRKILGKKNFHSEIAHPNPHLFPVELTQEKGRAMRPQQTTTFTSKVQFLSTKALMNEVTRLVTAKTPHVSGEDGLDVAMDTTGEGGKPTAARPGEEGDEEEEGDQEMQEDVSTTSSAGGQLSLYVRVLFTPFSLFLCCVFFLLGGGELRRRLRRESR